MHLAIGPALINPTCLSLGMHAEVPGPYIIMASFHAQRCRQMVILARYNNLPLSIPHHSIGGPYVSRLMPLLSIRGTHPWCRGY
jgi:hypothetical protein